MPIRQHDSSVDARGTSARRVADHAHRITFRPLAPSHFGVLLDWLRQPHVAAWWPGEHSAQSVTEDFGPMTDGRDSTRAFIVELDGRAIGYIQSYVAVESGDGWWQDVTDPGVRGIDQFIGAGDLLNRGVGTAMVRAFVADLFEDPAVTLVQTDPDPANHRAIRCYEKAGFQRVAVINTPDGVALLMVHQRPVST